MRSHLLALTLSVLITLTAASAVVPSHAADVAPPATRDAGPGFPAKASVKQAVGGGGGWRVFRGDVETLGSRPAGCQSDQQLLTPRSIGARIYSGRERLAPASLYSGVQVVVARYADVEQAREALVTNASYPVRCPRSTEWVCNECDGIATTWRTVVPLARVGQQSVAWKFREVGNLKSRGYTVVARSGSSIVRLTVTRTRTDVENGFRYPRLMKKQVAVRLARLAMRAAR